MTPTRYSSGPDVFAWLARELRQRGVQADALRLEEQSAAIRSRKRLDTKADIEHVRNLAIAVKKARRAAEVAHTVWAMNPSSSNRRFLLEAQQDRSEARAALLEACLQDESLFDDVLRSVS